MKATRDTPAFGDQRLPSRFWDKATQDHPQGCWPWAAAVSVKGYGRFNFEGRNRLAYGVAYSALIGPISAGLQLDHLCRNRACVNPAHLEPVTPRENTRRAPLMGQANKRKTHCPQGHPYDEANTYAPKQGHRKCRACAYALNLKRKRRKQR